jgi:uncharacterized oxidoreductase
MQRKQPQIIKCIVISAIKTERRTDMRITGNTILITGGATGIGFALAEAFIRTGNQVLICGRKEHKLLEAKGKLPQLHIKTCDIARESERQSLFEWTTTHYKTINILVNNAGIQRELDFRNGAAELSGESEIEVNFTAPVHLSALFIPHLINQPESAIVNISSGLAFIPIAKVPVYCATKAALHTFSVALRYQLRDTSTKIYEIIAPIVDTELDKGAREKRGQENRGIAPAELASTALKNIENDQFEQPIGMAQMLWQGARSEPEKVFSMINP